MHRGNSSMVQQPKAMSDLGRIFATSSVAALKRGVSSTAQRLPSIPLAEHRSAGIRNGVSEVNSAALVFAIDDVIMAPIVSASDGAGDSCSTVARTIIVRWLPRTGNRPALRRLSVAPPAFQPFIDPIIRFGNPDSPFAIRAPLFHCLKRTAVFHTSLKMAWSPDRCAETSGTTGVAVVRWRASSRSIANDIKSPGL